MSKSLSVASVIEKNKLASGTPFLAALDIEVVNPSTGVVAEVLHLVRNSEDIVFNGVTYTAMPFDIELKEEGGAQQQLNLRIKDITRAIQTRMQEYGGGIGFNVTFLVIRGDALNEAPEIMEFFQVVGASAAEYEANFQLGAENAVALTFPRRRQTKDFCQWRYKDPETCKYAGGMATCDLTLNGVNGCEAHENTHRFGAFPNINANGIRYG